MWKAIKSIVGGLIAKAGVADLHRITWTARADIGGPDLYPDFVKEVSAGPLAVRIEVGETNGEHFAEISGVYTDRD